MFEDGDVGGPETAGPETGGGAEMEPGGGAGDPGSKGGEGDRNAETTPKLDQGGKAGQDQTPADPDDVGVPSDEEIAEATDEAHEE